MHREHERHDARGQDQHRRNRELMEQFQVGNKTTHHTLRCAVPMERILSDHG
jgi:hypothetical protein